VNIVFMPELFEPVVTGYYVEKKKIVARIIFG
jgi:hypothetical protein